SRRSAPRAAAAPLLARVARLSARAIHRPHDSLTPPRADRRLPHSFCLTVREPPGRPFSRASPAVDCVQGNPMTRADQWKLFGVILVTVASLVFLWPSYRLYSMKPAQQAALGAKELSDLRRKALHPA